MPTNTTATVTAGASDGEGTYSFNVEAVGSTTHLLPLTLNIVSFALTTPTPASVTVPRGTTSSLVSFQVTAAGSFNQAVTVACNVPIPNSTCTLTPGATVNPTSSSPVIMTASVAAPAAAATGAYQVLLQATAAGAPAAITASFTVNVTTNPDFVLSEPSAFPEVTVGSTGTTGPISIAAQDGFSGTVNLSCSNTFGSGSCSVSPTSVSSYPATANLVINGTSFAADSYSINVIGTSGSDTHSLPIAFSVGDYSITGTQTLSLSPGGQGTANLTLTSLDFYSGSINATCNATALSAATCTLSPTSAIPVTRTAPGNLTATINVPNSAATGQYNIVINAQDTSPNGGPSHSFTIVLTVTQDFIVTPSPVVQSQTISAGQTSGPYNFAVQPVGSSFNQSVTLSCSGQPQFSQCLFNPSAPITPNSTAVSFVLTITTAGPAAQARRSIGLHALLIFWPGMAFGWIVTLKKPSSRGRTILTLFMLFLITVMMPSCGGVSSGGSGGGGQSTPSGTYSIVVTGTSGTQGTTGYLTHAAPAVTLIVSPS